MGLPVGKLARATMAAQAWARAGARSVGLVQVSIEFVVGGSSVGSHWFAPRNAQSQLYLPWNFFPFHQAAIAVSAAGF